MYGSILKMVTFSPRLSSKAPIEAEARPLPSDETTPPVTKMNLVRFPSFAIATLPQRCRASARARSRSSRCIHLDRQRGVVCATLMRNPHSSARNCSSFSACSSGVGARRANVSRKSRR